LSIGLLFSSPPFLASLPSPSLLFLFFSVIICLFLSSPLSHFTIFSSSFPIPFLEHLPLILISSLPHFITFSFSYFPLLLRDHLPVLIFSPPSLTSSSASSPVNFFLFAHFSFSFFLLLPQCTDPHNYAFWISVD
jgi:hypothetical protein